MIAKRNRDFWGIFIFEGIFDKIHGFFLKIKNFKLINIDAILENNEIFF